MATTSDGRQFAKPSAVPSRKKMLAFRTSTLLLSGMNHINPSSGHHIDLQTRRNIVKGKEASESVSQRLERKSHEDLDCLVSLMPKLMALSPEVATAKTNENPDVTMGGVNVSGPYRIFASTNPQWSEMEKPDIKYKEGPPLNVSLGEVKTWEDLISTIQKHGAAQAYFEYHKKTDPKKSTTERQLFIHAQNTLVMLQQSYNMKPGSEEARTWNTQFQVYSYLQMADKIDGRFKASFNVRNFGEILSSSISTLALSMQGTHSANGPSAAFEIINGLRFKRGGIERRDDTLEEAAQKGQTPTQEMILEVLYQSIAAWRDDKVEGVDHEINTDWKMSPLNANGDQDYVFYGQKGRVEFQRLFSSLLNAAWYYSRTFRKAKTAARQEAEKHRMAANKGGNKAEQKLKAWEKQGMKCVADLEKSVTRFRCAVETLSLVREFFDRILESHIAWLQDIRDPSSTHRPKKGNFFDPSAIVNKEGEGTTPFSDHLASRFSTPLANTPSSSKAAGTSVPTVKSTAELEVGTPDKKPEDVRTPEQLNFESLDVSGERKEDPPEMVAEEVPEMVTEEVNREFQSVDRDKFKVGWNVAASRCLGILCRHHDSITTLLEETEPEIIQRMKRAYIQPVVAKPGCLDQEIMPFAEFANQFRHPETGESFPEELQLHLVKFADSYYPASGTEPVMPLVYKGTWHAETTLLALHVLSIKWDDVVDAGGGSSSDDFLLLPSKALVDEFKDISNSLAVNKRCCSPCWKAVEVTEKISRIKLLTSGTHSDWTAVTFPPWTPNELFDPVYDSVQEELWTRMSALVHENEVNRSHNSGGTRNAPTDSSADDMELPNRLIVLYGHVVMSKDAYTPQPTPSPASAPYSPSPLQWAQMSESARKHWNDLRDRGQRLHAQKATTSGTGMSFAGFAASRERQRERPETPSALSSTSDSHSNTSSPTKKVRPPAPLFNPISKSWESPPTAGHQRYQPGQERSESQPGQEGSESGSPYEKAPRQERSESGSPYQEAPLPAVSETISPTKREASTEVPRDAEAAGLSPRKYRRGSFQGFGRRGGDPASSRSTSGSGRGRGGSESGGKLNWRDNPNWRDR